MLWSFYGYFCSVLSCPLVVLRLGNVPKEFSIFRRKNARESYSTLPASSPRLPYTLFCLVLFVDRYLRVNVGSSSSTVKEVRFTNFDDPTVSYFVKEYERRYQPSLVGIHFSFILGRKKELAVVEAVGKRKRTR